MSYIVTQFEFTHPSRACYSRGYTRALYTSSSNQVKMNVQILMKVKAPSSCGPGDDEDEGDGEVRLKLLICEEIL